MPIALSLDRDQTLHVAARLVKERALGQQVAGRVAPDVRRIRGQVEQLIGATEHDLDLLDRAVVALEAVVDPAAHEPAAELGKRPAERRALADARRSVLERDGSAGSSWRLDERGAGLGPRMTSAVPAKNACAPTPVACRTARAPRRPTRGVLAEPDERPGRQRPIPLRRAPSGRRSGRPVATPAGTSIRTPASTRPA